MTKISELQNITGNSTESRDLFVTVNIGSGSNGTKNITRAELAKAIQKEPLSNINVTGGSINNVDINNINLGSFNDFVNLNNDDYFIVKDTVNNTTVAISFKELQDEIAETFVKQSKIYVSADRVTDGNGSYYQPFASLDNAFSYIQQQVALTGNPISISVLPGTYYTNGNLALPDYCSMVSTNGQYTTNIVMNDGFEENNCILVGSGCYVQGFSFDNLRVDNFENPTGGFAIAFRPGATILRSPYIRDISQISNYIRESITAPLDPVNENPLVGRGGGVLLADRAVLNQNSVFTYMLAFGATPRSPNGVGYCAKNGAGINGISSISIFQRCAFYALNGGQITLNNSGTQFGDISMRAKGFTPIVDPAETTATLVKSEILANLILNNKQGIIDDLWTWLSNEGYDVNEDFTRRDAGNWLQSIAYDFLSGQQRGTRNFVAGFFDYKGDHVFDVNNVTLLNAFLYSYDRMKSTILDLAILNSISLDQTVLDMFTGLVDDVTKSTINSPTKINFGSLIESLGHQFNLAGAGVNTNALPLNFRRVGQPVSASGSVKAEAPGRVRWSGADELSNQYFAGGLKINGRTGRLEGRPFTASVRRIARRAANSRTFI